MNSFSDSHFVGPRLAEAMPAMIGLATIMHRAFAGDNLNALAVDLAQRIACDGDDMSAVMDLSIVLQIRNQHELAIELSNQALQQQQHYTLQRNPVDPDLRLLAIMGPGEIMANTPIEFLIEHDNIALEMLYMGEGLPVPDVIPEHDLAIVCPCHSDANANLLAGLEAVMQCWPRPYINSPAAIARQAREIVCQQLLHEPGVQVSETRRWSRTEIADSIDTLTDFPIIIRPVNSHAGHGLAKVNDRQELHDYLTVYSWTETFYLAPFIDYRSQDGKYRKARIAVIDGEPLVAHMAVSPRWMVHYLNADMLNNAEHRAEEARFMAEFEFEFGRRHRDTLARLDRIVGLDYYSIDCAETQDGKLVVFEIDSGAVVHAMDPVDVFPYKRPQMQRIFQAFRGLLERRVHAPIRQAA